MSNSVASLGSSETVAFTSGSSPLTIFQTDATASSVATDANAGDITNVIAESAVRGEVDVPESSTLLDIFAMWDVASDDITTNPQVRVWGLLPVDRANDSHSVDNNVFGTSALVAADEVWVPLTDFRSTTPTVAKEIDCASSSATKLPTTGTGAAFISPAVSVNVAGARKVLVATSTAAAHSDSGSVLIAGRFSS